MEMNRRDVLKTLALGGLAAGTLGLMNAKASAGEEKEILLNSNEIKPTPLSFDPKKLSGISEKLIVSHWENNYCGSVKALNGVNKQLKEAFKNKETSAFIINGLKREQLFRTGSVVNHNLYFENLGGSGKIEGAIKSALVQVFESENNWQTEFKRIAATLSGGSGWLILGYNYHLKVLENYWCYDHLHAPASTFPLLVLDMYEHSYQMDYGAAAGKYIDAYFDNISWEIVNSRFDKIKYFV